MSNRRAVSLAYEVRTEVVNTYEVDLDHFKEVTGIELYDATAHQLEDYVLENHTSTIHYDHADEYFLRETLRDEWNLED